MKKNPISIAGFEGGPYYAGSEYIEGVPTAWLLRKMQLPAKQRASAGATNQKRTARVVAAVAEAHRIERAQKKRLSKKELWGMAGAGISYQAFCEHFVSKRKK